MPGDVGQQKIMGVKARPEGRPDHGSFTTGGRLADGWYQIHILPDHQCLAPSTEPDGKISYQVCANTSRQLFYFARVGGDAFQVKSSWRRRTSVCLTVDTLVASEENLLIRPCRGSSLSQRIMMQRLSAGDGQGFLPVQFVFRVKADPNASAQVFVSGLESNFYLTAPPTTPR